MEDGSRPPKPDCNFDFNLPHGVDVEEATIPEQSQGLIESLASHSQVDCIKMKVVQHADRLSGDFIAHRAQNGTPQNMNLASADTGFSDDEGHQEAFDRSWLSRRAKKASPALTKSLRRWQEGDGDDEASPTKKARQSLFGGPAEEDQGGEEHVNGCHDVVHAPTNTSPEINDGMLSLYIDSDRQDVEQIALSPVTLGTSPKASITERDSMSPAPSLVPSDDDFDIPMDPLPAYDLRQNIDRLTSTTYFDNDRTGNYDPAQEVEQAKTSRLMKRKGKATKKGEKAKTKGNAKGQTYEDSVEKCIAVLRFRNFGNVRNLTNDKDNWPTGHSDIDPDWELERQRNREYYRSKTPGVQQSVVDDPCGKLDDLTGHPEARGCQECRRAEKDCPMVNGGTFPCNPCPEDGLVCKTILPPTEKGACERCVEEEEEAECSFENDPNQASCDHCSFHQHACIPLPPHDYCTPRISLDKILYGPDRKHVHCTVCRREKKRCSLKKKTDKPPCKSCKKNCSACTFEDLPSIEKNHAGKKKAAGPTGGNAPKLSRPGSKIFSAQDLADMYREDNRERVREPTPEIEMEDETGNKGMLTKIQTSFASPIKFNAFQDYTPDCNFCEMPMFGFVGYFEREVHVIRWYSGLGYTEVGGGHCAEQGGPTKMCQGCTYMRLQIICCPGHAFEAEPDAAGPLDFVSLANEIMSAVPGSEDFRFQQQRWCTLCFTPATVGCGTRQPSIRGGDDDEVTGCGTRLCKRCFQALQCKFSGNFELLAKAMADLPKTSEENDATNELQGKPRADVDFIRHEGLLMRCVAAGPSNQE
ncbi:hypothetical protein DE146DRAFT_523798 [Phaeosphaeria sp. MPI-PUGE-AT-0046c]|nr:hypothetical protein DE146DRAFT_523798 [Phaeosphaeria sp. MPI-PUGE-AT-0046c]